MAIRKLRYHNDHLLRKKSKPVKDIDGKLLTLLDDMRDTLESLNGLGLAAPQVGMLKRVAVVRFEPQPDDDTEDSDGETKPAAPEFEGTVLTGYFELINPEIIEIEGEAEGSEACLSLPGKSALVKRPKRVKVRATDRQGREFEVNGEGVLARAFCHELDHLDGVLYVDKISSGELEDDADEDE